MKDKPILTSYEEKTFIIGQDTFIDSIVENNNAVIFEDNEETGYFYAIDKYNRLGVLDALHIYNVADVIDKNIPSILKILWTADYSKSFLSINDYYHAVFDFQRKAGYCRNGFPDSQGNWAIVSERLLTDELLIELSKNV